MSLDGKNKKLAVLEDYFIPMYIEALVESCHSYGITVDLYTFREGLAPYAGVDNVFYAGENPNLKSAKSIKEFNKRLYEMTKDKGYDYVLSDYLPLSFGCCVFHVYSIVERMRLCPNFLYRLIFYLGHYQMIKYFKNLFQKQPKIFAVSSIVKDDLVRNCNIPEERIKIIFPGCENSELVEEYDIKKYDRTKPFVFGLSAVGFVRKGGFLFLDAIRRLKKDYPNIKAKIIYPDYKKNLGLMLYLWFYNLKDTVEIVGYQKDMSAFYRSLDCLVVPSIFEAFGRVVIEGMTHKIPVIVGSGVGAKDIIKDGENGFVFEAEGYSGKPLAEKMKEVIRNYNNLDNLVNSAYTLSKSGFTWKNFGEEIFKELYLS